MTLLQTFPFTFNKDEIAGSERFPDMANGGYAFQFVLDNRTYSVGLSWNLYTKCPYVTVYDSDNQPLNNALVLSEQIGENGNYLYFLDGYGLYWTPQGGFSLYALL